MAKLTGKVYSNKEFGQGEPLERLSMRHPLHDPSIASIRKLFAKSDYEPHPGGMFANPSRQEAVEQWKYTAAIHTSIDGKSRQGSGLYRILCRKRGSNES